jgi:integrase
MGQLYQRGRVWWVKYYLDGRPLRESTGVAGVIGRGAPQAAKTFLKQREGRVAAGMPVLPRADRIRYEEIEADLKQHYEATGSRDLKEYKRRVQHLTAAFRGRRVMNIGQVDVDQYVVARNGQGAKGSTIRRELGTLTKMLRLAYKNGKLLRLPLLDKPKEGPPREGFFEREQYESVRRRLGADLQVAVTIAYTYGWRMQSEVLPLERRQLDVETGTLRLDAGTTKNDEGRVVYLTPELKVMLAAQVERVDALQRRLGRIIPYLFPHAGRGTRAGKPRRDFRKTWATACKDAGVAGRFRHDFRRTAVRNLVNAGVPERVAMSITGHKTRSVFDRYHIVSPGDLQEAMRRLTGTIRAQSAPTAVDTSHVTS